MNSHRLRHCLSRQIEPHGVGVTHTVIFVQDGLIVSANSDTRGVTNAPTVVNARRVPIGGGMEEIDLNRGAAPRYTCDGRGKRCGERPRDSESSEIPRCRVRRRGRH